MPSTDVIGIAVLGGVALLALEYFVFKKIDTRPPIDVVTKPDDVETKPDDVETKPDDVETKPDDVKTSDEDLTPATDGNVVLWGNALGRAWYQDVYNDSLVNFWRDVKKIAAEWGTPQNWLLNIGRGVPKNEWVKAVLMTRTAGNKRFISSYFARKYRYATMIIAPVSDFTTATDNYYSKFAIAIKSGVWHQVDVYLWYLQAFIDKLEEYVNDPIRADPEQQFVVCDIIFGMIYDLNEAIISVMGLPDISESVEDCLTGAKEWQDNYTTKARTLGVETFLPPIENNTIDVTYAPSRLPARWN